MTGLFNRNKDKEEKIKEPEPDILCKFCNSNKLYEFQTTTLISYVNSVNDGDSAESILVCKDCGKSTVE